MSARDTARKAHIMSNGFPSFYEWLTSDEDRKRDYEYAAVRHLDTFGMTGDASRIIRDHADSAARDFSDNIDAEDIDGRAAEDFMDGYEFETYDGPTRAALVHWAWNSDLDLTEWGPLQGDNIWEQIEHMTWHQVNGAAHHALTTYAEEYAEERKYWTARQPCQWFYLEEYEGKHWWGCETHDDNDAGSADTPPATPCDSADTDEQED